MFTCLKLDCWGNDFIRGVGSEFVAVGTTNRLGGRVPILVRTREWDINARITNKHNLSDQIVEAHV